MLSTRVASTTTWLFIMKHRAPPKDGTGSIRIKNQDDQEWFCYFYQRFFYKALTKKIVPGGSSALALLIANDVALSEKKAIIESWTDHDDN